MAGRSKRGRMSFEEELEERARDQVARDELELQRKLEETEKREKELKLKRARLHGEQQVADKKADILDDIRLSNDIKRAELMKRESDLAKETNDIPVEVKKFRAFVDGVDYVPDPPSTSATRGAARGPAPSSSGGPAAPAPARPPLFERIQGAFAGPDTPAQDVSIQFMVAEAVSSLVSVFLSR